MKKRSTIPTIFGVLILVIGSFAGVFLLRNNTVFRLGADVSTQPKNIRTANISDTSVTINWTTDKEATGFVSYGTSSSSTTKIANEGSSDKKYFNHSVTLSGLSANTKYYYKINSEGVNHDNTGVPWEFSTGPDIGNPKSSVLVSGSVINASGIPSKKALVYVDIDGYLLTTQTSDTGNFVIQIGNARTPDLQNYADVNLDQTLVQLSIQATPDGVASAQIFPKSANPVPPIIIGQTYDFRNEPTNNLGGNPNADLNLPQNVEKQSKFNISIPSETPKPTSVILESLSEGEEVTSTQPQFFGKGPGGTELKITIHSDEEISSSVEIPPSGSWSFETPTNLTPGNHTITISWVDVTGITRFFTRSFVVKAGEVPAFTASESGSTATPTSSPSPGTSATPEASASPTLTPSPSSTATAIPVPTSGDLTPTLLLFIMGLVVMTFSLFVWKMSENA